MGGLQRMAAILAHPRWPWVAAILGVLLASSSLSTGLVLDDHLHRFAMDAHLRGEGMGAWWDLYSAAEGDEALTRARMDQGLAPWWTAPDLRVRLWRPLSAATHYLDHLAWPGSPWLMHAHGLLWYGALVVGVGALLRRWLGAGWVAGLATLCFAVDDAHALPAGWIAQRNALVGGVLVVATLWAHDRAVRERWRPGAWLAPLLLLLALLAVEASVAALGYLLAHALWLGPDDGRPHRRVRALGALWPYLAVTIAWRIAYDALGHGAQGSGVYLDPVREPGVFLAALPERLAALAWLQLGWPGADGATHPSAGWTLAALTGLGLALVPRLRCDRGLVACVVGGALALVPAAATVPSDRLLVLAGVGGSAAVAGVIAVALQRGPSASPSPSPSASPSASPRWPRALAVLLGVPLVAVHLVLAPVSLSTRAGALHERLERPQHDVVHTLPADASLADQELVIVNSPPTFVSAYLWLLRWNTDQALPRRLRVLGSTFGPVIVQRPDARTLVLQPVGGYFGDPFTALARGRARPFAAGDAVALQGWRVEILAVAQGRPTSVRIVFALPLDDPRFRWVAWHRDRFEPFALPAIGHAVALPGAP